MPTTRSLFFLHARSKFTVKKILEDYATSIGLKINFNKSTLIPINCEATKCEELANVLGFVVGKMPFTYLGLPLGTSRPSLNDFMPMVSKVERNLSSTLSLMSYAGKLMLLNTAVTSLLIYAMCTLKFSPKLIEILDKIRRRCLWVKKTDQGEKSNSLAAWDLVCKPKDKGGLGVIDIKTQNVALLLKHLYKFYNRLDVPWVTLIWDTYYVNTVPHAVDPIGSFWWRDIMQLSHIF